MINLNMQDKANPVRIREVHFSTENNILTLQFKLLDGEEPYNLSGKVVTAAFKGKPMTAPLQVSGDVVSLTVTNDLLSDGLNRLQLAINWDGKLELSPVMFWNIQTPVASGVDGGSVDILSALINQVQAFNLFEAYDPLKQYRVNNKVSYQGSSYVCIKDSVGISTEVTEHWLLIAAKGERGLQGIQGIQGIQGPQGDKGDKGDKGDAGEQGPAGGLYVLDDSVSAPDKVWSSQKVNAQLAETENRINNIIVTPAEGVSEQEILDARQGKGSLGDNITEIKNQVTGVVNNGYYIPVEKIQIPVELGFTVPMSIKKTGVGNFETNIEPESFYPSNPLLKTYYVSKSGLNTNDGLTLATAFQNISKALSMPDVETIMIASGWYNKDEHPAPAKNVKFKAIPGHDVVFGADSAVTWTPHSGATHKCTRSATTSVWDITKTDNYGNYVRMVKKSSVADVIATPHSWYFDSATNTVYAHMFDDRAPDSSIKVTVNVNVMQIASNYKVYMDGIKCYFGTPLNIATPDGALKPAIFAKRCEFNYADTLNGVNVNGAELAIFKDCEASHNYKDGFNYHDKNGATGQFIEINCVARKNGLDSAGNNNGSTAHENQKGIRVGGQYSENDGPNVADVTASKSLNVGCLSYGATNLTGVKADFYADVNMWLDNCYTKDSQYSVYVGVGADIKVRNSILLNPVLGAAGTY